MLENSQQNELLFKKLTVEERKWKVSRKNPECPLNKFIGNPKAIRRLARAAFSAMGNRNRDCSDYSLAVCGPPSTGKTYLTKLFAKTVGLPLVVIEPQTVKRVQNIFDEISLTCREFSYEDIVQAGELTLKPDGKGKFSLPPVIVFIDEVHNLKSNVVQGLLKATEPNDRIMITEEGQQVATNKVCWMIATTDRGDLFDAFDTRFQKVNLRLYSKDEMAKIVQMNNPDWDIEVCKLVATYNPIVPREAIAFAKDMRVEYEMNPSEWMDVAKRTAEDHGIDEFGMTYARLNVLKALGRSTMSASQMPFVVHVKEDELRKYIMPPLLARTPDQQVPFVTVCSRGYSITKAGLAELDRRGISHRGLKAMPESVAEMFTDAA